MELDMIDIAFAIPCLLGLWIVYEMIKYSDEMKGR